MTFIPAWAVQQLRLQPLIDNGSLPSPRAMISVEHLTRMYGQFTAVDDLTFDVGPGEIVGLIGPNGAGKTTTLRALAGILRPTAGHIRIAGHDLASDPIEAKRRLAFMPDEPHL